MDEIRRTPMPKEKVIKRLKSQIATCKEIDSDWISLTVETGKRILELIEERDPVVHCRDCKHNIYDFGCNMISCRIPNQPIRYHAPDWFCGDGERRDGDG